MIKYFNLNLKVPILIVMSQKRWIVSAGVNFLLRFAEIQLYAASDGTKSYHNLVGNSQNTILNFQESISYRPSINKNIYIKFSAEHASNFFKGDNYSNWFMFGCMYGF